MNTLESRVQSPDPKFAHLDYIHPFDLGSETSEGTIGSNVVEVDKTGRVIGIIGTFTSRSRVTYRK